MKKIMIASLAAAGALFAVVNQAHAGTTFDAVKKKGSSSVGSVTACPVSHTPMPMANLAGLTSMSVAGSPLPSLAMPAK